MLSFKTSALPAQRGIHLSSMMQPHFTRRVRSVQAEEHLQYIEGGDVGRSQLDFLQQHHVIVALQQPLVAHHLQQQLLHTQPQPFRA